MSESDLGLQVLVLVYLGSFFLCLQVLNFAIPNFWTAPMFDMYKHTEGGASVGSREFWSDLYLLDPDFWMETCLHFAHAIHKHYCIGWDDFL